MVSWLIALVSLSAPVQADLERALAIGEAFPTATAGARLEAVVRTLPDGPDPVRGRALLRALHAPGLLQRYDEHATTVSEVLLRGRFNCVSASVLYVLAARDAGLETQVELLPTHARVRIRLGGEWSVVETTSPHGFDPSQEVQAEVASRVMPTGTGRSLVDERGEWVDFDALLGATLVNLATLAQAEGDLARAEQLFASGEELVSSPKSKAMLRDQRAAVLARLALGFVEAEGLLELERAQDILVRAQQLQPGDAQVRFIVARNLRAVSERVVRGWLERGDLARATQRRRFAMAEMTPAEGAGLFVFDQLARAQLASEAGQTGAAVNQLEAAWAKVPRLGADDAKLSKSVRTNLLSMLPAHAEALAVEGKLEPGLKLLDRWGALAETSPAAKAARLYRLAGHARLEAQDYTEAASIFEKGWRRYGDDPSLKQDLQATLQRVVLPYLEAENCPGAEPTLELLERVDPADVFPAQARFRCWMQLAQSLARDKLYPKAVIALDRARPSAEQRPVWKKAKISVLRRWGGAYVKGRQCELAAELHRELEQLGSSLPSDAKATCGF